MGTFKEKIVLANSEDASLKMEVDCIVDTGATYSWIPSDKLKKIQVEEMFMRKFKLADGRTVERPMTEVLATLKGMTIHTLVAFGDVGSESLLGAFTLEGFGLAPDPVNKTLVPVPALLLNADTGRKI